MEFFLREYAARSILPHLNTATKINTIHNNHYQPGIINISTVRNAGSSLTNSKSNQSFIINSSNEDSVSVIGTGGSSDNNLYFIQPQHELLHDVLGNFASVGGSSVGVVNQNEDYSEYLNINNDSTILPSSSPTIHLLASLASVTTTTISSITHQIKLQTEETFHEFLTAHQMNNDSLATFSCDGESQPISALNSSLMGADDDSGGGGDGSESALSSIYFKTAVYLLYIPIFVFALLGNGTVCYIVQSTPRMRTVTNYFIANLAVGDILMSLFCVPSSFISIFILGYWPFGMALCHLVNYSQAVSVLVSAYTLVAISIDRYSAIMWPLRPRITKRYAKFIIAGIWIIALATAFPIPIVSKLVQPGDWHVHCERYVCQEEWSSTEQNYYYTLALLTLQFLVPLSVLIFTYTRIALAVWGKRPPGEAENSRDQRMARSKRKL